MFTVKVNKNVPSVASKDVITSGTVNVAQINFEFSEEWNDLHKEVIFETTLKGSTVRIHQAVESTSVIPIPWELLTEWGQTIRIGVYGTKDEGEVVFPTVWTTLGVVKEGVTISGALPTLPWDPSDTSGGSGGTMDHRLLSHRDSDDQHSLGAISGLTGKIDEFSKKTTPITNEELEAILK